MDQVIIIGSGLAGYTLAKELRKKDKQTPITVISRDDGRFYSKPMLSNGLSKQKSADGLVTHDSAQMADSLNLTVLNHTAVTNIDTHARQVAIQQADTTSLLGYSSLGYSSLVLAVGASQIRLPIAGDGATSVISVNDLTDYALFRQHLESAARVALIGPGLIGCEFANDLANIGKHVTVIGPDRWPLERLMPELAGNALKAILSNQGVKWVLGNVVAQANHADKGVLLTLDSGAQLQADLVLSAAGLVANTALANDAGIATQRGIVVDQYLKTSTDNVYALGDCAEICGLVMPYVMPIMLASKALAKTLQGERTKVVFPAMPVAVKTPSYPIVVSPPADFDAGQWRSEAAQGGAEQGVKSRFENERGGTARLCPYRFNGYRENAAAT